MAPRRARDFCALLDALLENTSGDRVTLGQLLDIAGRRTFGPVILLLGFISVSPLTVVPGANWLVAAVTLAFSLQLLIGQRKPMLPPRLLRMEMPRAQLEQAVKAARPAARWADQVTEPRLSFLTEPPFVVGPALACICAALVTFPLGLVPLGPVLPGVSIILLGVGLTARDGLFLTAALLALTGSVLMSVAVLEKWFSIMVSWLS